MVRDIRLGAARSHSRVTGQTPDENDLFPSTPLDEDQLHNADLKLKEELGSVVINEIEDQQDLAWSDIPWTDPRWLDPRPLVYNAAENAEVFAMNVWHKFQSWKVVGFSNLPQFLQVQETEIFSILTRPLHLRTMISSRRVIDLPCRASKSVSSRYSVSTPRLAISGHICWGWWPS